MSGDRPGEPCEGGCGCRVRYWRDKPWEMIESDPARPTPRMVTSEPHTPERCRIIRVLRQASESAAGPGGTAVIALRPNGLVVCAWTAHSRWARQQIAWQLLLRGHDGLLDSLAAHVCEHLRRALDPASPAESGRPEALPVLARNPMEAR